MPQVAVNINGKIYRMACDEGQEAHLLDLAKEFNKSITRLKESFGEIGDQRLTVMAGIMAHDRLNEMQNEIDILKNKITKNENNENKTKEQVQQITQHINNINEKLRA